MRYEDLLYKILTQGARKDDRTGTGTLSLFGEHLRYDLSAGFPIVTTKRVHLRSVIYELLWFLRGDTNVRWLQERGVSIWNEWADENGDLGPIYGAQWRAWPTTDGAVDQLADAVDTLRADPNSRRVMVSAWNVADLPKMAMAPCHVLFQLYAVDGRLSCQVYQRSADMFLGVPFNLASYALLTHMIAQQCDMTPGDLSWVGGDCHIYLNHLEQVREQLGRAPYPFPKLELASASSLFSYTYNDVWIVD